jgi:hypothetical protein
LNRRPSTFVGLPFIVVASASMIAKCPLGTCFATCAVASAIRNPTEMIRS